MEGGSQQGEAEFSENSAVNVFDKYGVLPVMSFRIKMVGVVQR